MVRSTREREDGRGHYCRRTSSAPRACLMTGRTLALTASTGHQVFTVGCRGFRLYADGSGSAGPLPRPTVVARLAKRLDLIVRRVGTLLGVVRGRLEGRAHHEARALPDFV